MEATISTKVGYKKTKAGWIPEDWELKALGDISEVKGGKRLPKGESLISEKNAHPYIRVADMFWGGVSSKNIRYVPETVFPMIKSYTISKDDLFITVAGTLGVIGKIPTDLDNANLTENADKITKIACNKEFLFFILCSKIVQNEIESEKTTNAQPKLALTRIRNFKIPLPPLPEQKKIADILSTWDNAIETTQDLIEKLQLRKKGLMQQLLSGKKRLPGFSEKWEEMSLSEILISAGKKVVTKDGEEYRQIGVRSHTKGIFHKKKVTGLALGNKRVFWIEPDCFIVNIVFAWEHAIAKTTNTELGMIASHRFPMYKPKEGVLNLDFLLYFFKTPKGKYLLQLASPGGAGRNKTLGKTEFLRLQIPVPSLNEQKRIAQVLAKSDEEIHQTQDYLKQLQKQKKGLMQQLLNGKKRVIV